MSELRSHFDPFLSLAEHLAEIREAASAIWGRHSQTLRRVSNEACNWFEDSVNLHDAGKASQAFQQYIADPPKFRGPKDSKVHTPLSTACALRHAEDQAWDWRRALAVALIAAGHHSEFKTTEELDHGICSMDRIIDQQIRSLDWDALDRAIGIAVPRPDGMSGEDICVAASEYLEELVEELTKLVKSDPSKAVEYRLLCQLAFSVLLEADKAYLAVSPKDRTKYRAAREAVLPADLVEEAIARETAGKQPTAIGPLREEARRAMFAGLKEAGGCRVQTMTLPTGTGKTLLAASWALSLREQIAREEGQQPLVLIVLPFLAIIDQTVNEYEKVFKGHVDAGDMISYHSLSDRTYAPDLEDKSQDFFLNTWQSDVVVTTFDQFLFALLSPKSRHQMRFHHLTDALIVMDEVQALPCVLWDPLQKALEGLTKLGTTRILAMSATQPGFLNAPHELIDANEEFFRRMKRYRIILRHREPLKFLAFIDECKGRLPEWAGKRVLITLNTRRSARRMRDELEEFLPAGMELEFLSADVAPVDRLAAIARIKQHTKNKQPCLVVSTQCIEAGVDIDMDLVLRDFGPLDSIIQIAGRCNRNFGPERCTVEIVSLLDDDSGRAFAGMIYDKILLQATQQVLAGAEVINEEAVFPLTKAYFSLLVRDKDTGEKETRLWLLWQEMTSVRKLLRGAQRPQVSFVVTENDPGLRGELEKVLEIRDRWDRRRALQKLARRIAENTVSVYQRDDLDPANYADPFPANKTSEDVWFWLLHPNHYTRKRGLDLGGKDGEPETWGIIA
jgi:CRISPR-associated endonuclease/helicase Cas3